MVSTFSCEAHSRIVLSQSHTQIIAQTGVESFRIALALENVDVEEFCHARWLAES